MTERPHRLKPDELMERTVSLFRAESKQKGTVLRFDMLADPHPTILGDRRLPQRLPAKPVLARPVENVLQYTAPGRTLPATNNPEHPVWKPCIAGVGMPPGDTAAALSVTQLSANFPTAEEGSYRLGTPYHPSRYGSPPSLTKDRSCRERSSILRTFPPRYGHRSYCMESVAMKALRFRLHTVTPERHKLERIAEALQLGAILLYPTDTGFALGCQLGNKFAIDRLRLIRHLPSGKPLTFLCDSLRHLSEFAYVSTQAYRILKRLVPGPYTFILPATKAVPYYAQDLKRKTAGIRVPDSSVCLALLRIIGSPIISISAVGEEESTEAPEPEAIVERFAALVDIIVELDDYHFLGPSTIIDLTEDPPRLLRRGAGLERALEVLPLEETP